MSRCLDLCELRIVAPILLYLCICVDEDALVRFSLISAPRLKQVDLYYFLHRSDMFYDSMGEEEDDSNEIDEVENLLKLLMNLGHLESFSISWTVNLFKVSSFINH